MIQILQPPDWARPKGFTHGLAIKGGTTVYIAGQIGCGPDGRITEPSFAGQFRQALANILAVLRLAHGHGSYGQAAHIVRLTWYVLDRQEYLDSLKDVGAAYRELMGRNYPVMAVVQVSGLVEPGARLEIEATAVIPDPDPVG